MVPQEPSIPQGPAASAFDEELRQLWDWNIKNHAPTPAAIRKIEGLRSTAIAMKDAIIALSPHSRERSLALTNLEQVVFYSVAAVARNENVDKSPETPGEDQAAQNDKPNSDEGAK